MISKGVEPNRLICNTGECSKISSATGRRNGCCSIWPTTARAILGRSFFYKELKALLEKALAALPAEEVKKHYRARRRPRRAGKPLWNE
jgi:hypothetical protein